MENVIPINRGIEVPKNEFDWAKISFIFPVQWPNFENLFLSIGAIVSSALLFIFFFAYADIAITVAIAAAELIGIAIGATSFQRRSFRHIRLNIGNLPGSKAGAVQTIFIKKAAA